LGGLSVYRGYRDTSEVYMNQEPIKKKLELDIDVTPHNQGANPYQKWIIRLSWAP